jgi:hypothetical protein
MNKISTSQFVSKIKSQATIFGKYLQKQTPENPEKFVRWTVGGVVSYKVYSALKPYDVELGSETKYWLSAASAIVSWYAPYTMSCLFVYDTIRQMEDYTNSFKPVVYHNETVNNTTGEITQSTTTTQRTLSSVQTQEKPVA